MQSIQKYKPTDGVNVDVADKYLKNTESRYLLNAELTGMNSNEGVTTPRTATVVVPFIQPDGINTTIGKHYSKRTQELYVFVHNSKANHHIYRVNGNGTSSTLVLMDSRLGFSLDKKYRIKHRAHLFFNNNNFVSRGDKLAYKYLLWTTGENWQGFLDVETSIATNGFRTPYFTTPDRRIYWQLPPRPSLSCPTVAWLPNQAGVIRNNVMLYTTWQFRYKGIFTDGRETAWSPISEAIFHQKSACEDEESYERCVKITMDAMTPQVEKWVIAYRNCAGNYTDDQNPEWFICDYVNRYTSVPDVPFFERQINPKLNFDAVTNTFQYTYCGDRLCIPIDKQQTDLNYNDIPITSFGLFPLDDRVGLANNDYGNDPVSPAELGKITFDLIGNTASPIKIETATVKVAVIIHNNFVNLNQPIYYSEKDGNPEGHRNIYGGLCPGSWWYRKVDFNLDSPTWDFVNGEPYKQYFEQQNGNFLLYVDGTPFLGRTRQWRADPSGKLLHEEYLSLTKEHNATLDTGRQIEDNEYYMISIAEIKVPKGTSGYIRIASTLATTDSDYQATSANVFGILNNRAAYKGDLKLNANNCRTDQKELFFNTCSGDVDLTDTPMVIADLTYPGWSLSSFGLTGYLKAEERKDGEVLSESPVEKAAVLPFGAFDEMISSTVTDHNGYYFAAYAIGSKWIPKTVGVDFRGAVDCADARLEKWEQKPLYHSATEKDVFIRGDYFDSNYHKVKVLVRDSNGRPLSGIKIAGTGTKAKATGADGYANLIFRNAANRSVQIMPMQSALCPLSTTAGMCVPMFNVQLPGCLTGEVTTYDQLPAFLPSFTTKGLMPGGSYPLAVKFIDEAGRESNAQGDWVMDMPQVVETGDFSFSTIHYNIPALNLPAWVSKMAILIGKNRNQEDALSWVVDDVKFVDAAGVDTTSFAAEKIKISIKSLYTLQGRLSNLNVKYQFMKGDRVRFLVNSDGNIFPSMVDSYIEGDENNREAATANENGTPVEMYSYLTIPYQKELNDIKPGTVIQIYTQRVCQNQDYLYETCQLIDVRKNLPVTGPVNAFDTFLIRRTIAYNDKVNFFPYPFLHHSPSDFWGDHCISRGRISVKNPYEKRLRLGRNMAMSLPFFTNGNSNGLGTYLAQFQKNFTGEQRGDIVDVISAEQYLLFILEHDNFIASAGDDFVKLDSDNRLRANAGEMTITDANSKISGNYGCRYEDVGSVVVGDGWVFWFDYASKAPVLHDFQQAKNLAEGKMESYFSKKLTGEVDIIAGLDPARARIYLTMRKDNSFVHSNHEILYDKNETLSIELAGRAFEFVSFTPEFFGHHLDFGGEQVLVTFINGLAYAHTRVGATDFNTFYGTPCDQVIDFVLNDKPDKIKIPVAMQIQSSISYYAELITTSEGQESMIVPARSKKVTERKHDMEFVCDSKSKGGLYGGNALRGYTIRIRLVRDNTNGVLINTIDENKQKKYSELDAVLVKYSFSEQSAYKNS